MATLKVTKDDVSKVLASLKSLGDSQVLVGIPSKNAQRQDGEPINNAELGYIHTHGGTIAMPEREQTIYRSIDARGELARGGKFVKKKRSNFATTHKVAAHSVTIPPRPFLEPGIRNAQPKITAALEKAAKAALDDNADKTQSALTAAGMAAQGSVQSVIENSQGLAPLAKSTIAARKSRGVTRTKPLLDTGGLLQSITYVIRDKKKG